MAQNDARKYILYYNNLLPAYDVVIYIFDTIKESYYEFSVAYGSLTKSDVSAQFFKSKSSSYTKSEIYGIIGAFEFYPYGFFLLCVTKCEEVLSVGNPNFPHHKVYTIVEASFPFFDFENKQHELSITSNTLHPRSSYLSIKSLLEGICNQKGLYFSETRNLATKNTSRILYKENDDNNDNNNNSNNDILTDNTVNSDLPANSNSIDRNYFIFNNFAKSNITLSLGENDKELPFLLNIIQGYYSSSLLKINGNDVYLELIYRRLQNNNGRRFFNRGTNNCGHTANFVEVEATMSALGHTYIYYVTRGTVPLFFTQLPFLLGPERFRIMKAPGENKIDVKKHLEILKNQYAKNLYIVSLLNHAKREKKLHKAYFDALNSIKSEEAENPRLEFLGFDFHHETQGLKYEKVDELIGNLAEFFNINSYYEFDRNNRILSSQNGIFRINCVDSLDRTGVVVNSLLKYAIKTWLTKLSLFDSVEQEFDIDVDYLLRNIFADSSDLLSMQYSGTRANKSDYTRSGTRTVYGQITDLLTSTKRKIFSLTSDVQIEDSYRLFLGYYDVGHYFKTNNLCYPYFSNLRPNEVVYIACVSAFLISGFNILTTLLSGKITWMKCRFSAISLISAGLILRKFNYNLIFMPHFPKIL